MCERELEIEQNYNILTPTLLAITAFLSRSPGLLNRGPGGPLCWVLAFSTASYLQLQLLNRGPEGPLCWVLAFSTASCVQLIEIPVHWVKKIVQRPPSSCGRHKSHSFNPSTVKVIFWYPSTGCTCYLHRCISYFDRPAGSEINIQQNNLKADLFDP